MGGVGLKEVRRKGPRRRIQEIVRTGRYGNVEYRHLLECDHVEVRKRASRAPEIACGQCVAGEPMPRRVGDEEVTESLDSSLATTEERVAWIRATIARRLLVDADAVDVRLGSGSGGLEIVGATVYLTGQEAERLIA